MLDQNFLDAIKKFEGYSAEARWDYAQNSNGYGTRARYAGEVIDKAEADRRFESEIRKAVDIVDRFAPGLDDGSRAALTSLTYNAGTAWTQSGLGDAVSSGDFDKARALFLQYNKAGGAVVDGLVQRRLQEVTWFGAGTGTASTSVVAAARQETALPAASAGDISPASALSLSSSPQVSERQPRSLVRLHDEPSSRSASPRSFADLGSDPALMALLARIGKSQPTRSSDDEAAKLAARPQSA